jgi:hypothetical protein
MNKKQLAERNAKRKLRRENKNFRAVNYYTTNSSKMNNLQEDIVLNHRRHKNIQNLAKDLSKRQVRTLLYLQPELDS